jgi:hypothetical protein
MKKIIIFLIITLLSAISFAQVGIGTTTPNASAIIELNSSTKGFLLPRLTLAQKNSMTPTAGIQIYCTDCGTGPGELQIYNGTSWTNAQGTPANGIIFGPPSNVSAIYGNTQASISFSAPTATLGLAVTDYTVTSSPDNITANGTSSPIVVTGLTAGTSYTFTVVASNAAGNSVASAISNAVTPYTFPGTPTNHVATAGNEQASIAFTAPASNGGSVITGYSVTSSPGGFTATGASSPLVVTGLTAGTSYTFTVVATNAAGNSATSDASNAVTPQCLSSVTFTYNGASVTYGVITRTINGTTKCWLDRNLGATRVATIRNDAASYGHYFQWGRGDDGHQLTTSSITGTKIVLGTTSALFVWKNGTNTNWLTVNNNDLWQGTNGINNPCPAGFRVPTKADFAAEMATWPGGTTSAWDAAYNNPLKIPSAGIRNADNPSMNNVGVLPDLWTSTIGNTSTEVCNYEGNGSSPGYFYSGPARINGLPVRCVK